ncbi:MAG TPA: RDD family protein [Thermoplasmata archaeon]|jgi:uncharacterized RDD family membrane protein YckC
MVTGFDYLSHDEGLQSHWLKRFVAIVIDSIIIWLPMWIILTIIGVSYLVTGGFFGILLFLYCAFFELQIGGTPGKMLMHMKAVPMQGTKLTAAQAFMRNVSKVFVLLLLLDWILGLLLDTADPRQKWTDRAARTSVIVTDHPGGT